MDIPIPLPAETPEPSEPRERRVLFDPKPYEQTDPRDVEDIQPEPQRIPPIAWVAGGVGIFALGGLITGVALLF